MLLCKASIPWTRQPGVCEDFYHYKGRSLFLLGSGPRNVPWAALSNLETFPYLKGFVRNNVLVLVGKISYQLRDESLPFPLPLAKSLLFLIEARGSPIGSSWLVRHGFRKSVA